MEEYNAELGEIFTVFGYRLVEVEQEFRAVSAEDAIQQAMEDGMVHMFDAIQWT